jgi:hypothetical protein
VVRSTTWSTAWTARPREVAARPRRLAAMSSPTSGSQPGLGVGMGEAGGALRPQYAQLGEQLGAACHPRLLGAPLVFRGHPVGRRRMSGSTGRLPPLLQDLHALARSQPRIKPSGIGLVTVVGPAKTPTTRWSRARVSAT